MHCVGISNVHLKCSSRCASALPGGRWRTLPGTFLGRNGGTVHSSSCCVGGTLMSRKSTWSLSCLQQVVWQSSARLLHNVF